MRTTKKKPQGRPQRALTTTFVLALLAVVLLAALAAAAVVGGCASGNAITLDVPAELEPSLVSGAPEADYVYYALADSAPDTWEDFQKAGLHIVSDERPPFIPAEVATQLDGGGFPPGSGINLDWEGKENTLPLQTVVAYVGLTYEARIENAIAEMEQTPGMLMLNERGRDFEGKDRMVEVSLE